MFNKIIRQLKTRYSAWPWFRELVKKASGSPPYFWLTKLKVKSQIPKDLEGPFNLVIETSSFCNARCLMCPNSSMKRQKKVMSDQVFEKIVERVKAEKLPINKVFFSGLGEPLFDHQVISRLKAFKDMGLRVRFYTNASLLSEEKSRQMVELGLDEMNISFNGTNPEQYRKVMGLDFVRTRENIERLLEIRKEKHSSLPVIQVSLVLLKENEKDINSHRQNWQGRVDSVTVSLAHQWGGGVRIENTASWISGENWKLKIKNSDRVYPCRSLWHTFVLDAEGNFVLCCRDFESRFVLGNILTHSFEQIVQSPLLQEFRQKHLRFDEKNLPEICCFCNFPYQDGVEWYLPRSID